MLKDLGKLYFASFKKYPRLKAYSGEVAITDRPLGCSYSRGYSLERNNDALCQCYCGGLGEVIEKIEGAVVFGETPEAAAMAMAEYLDGEITRVEKTLAGLAKMKKDVLAAAGEKNS